jgi:diaminopimelate decarboxylase
VSSEPLNRQPEAKPARGLTLSMVNLGGGFPTKYLKNVPTVKTYGSAIFRAAAAFRQPHPANHSSSRAAAWSAMPA